MIHTGWVKGIRVKNLLLQVIALLLLSQACLAQKGGITDVLPPLPPVAEDQLQTFNQKFRQLTINTPAPSQPPIISCNRTKKKSANESQASSTTDTDSTAGGSQKNKKDNSEDSSQKEKQGKVDGEKIPPFQYDWPTSFSQADGPSFSLRSLHRLQMKVLACSPTEDTGYYQPAVFNLIRPDGSTLTFMMAIPGAQPQESQPLEAAASTAVPGLIETLTSNWQSVLNRLYQKRQMLVLQRNSSQLIISQSDLTSIYEEGTLPDADEHPLEDVSVYSGAPLDTIVLPAPARATAIADLSSVQLSTYIDDLLSGIQTTATVAMDDASASDQTIPVSEWIARFEQESFQGKETFEGSSSPLEQAISVVTGTLQQNMLVTFIDQKLSARMEAYKQDRIVDLKTAWIAYQLEIKEKKEKREKIKNKDKADAAPDAGDNSKAVDGEVTEKESKPDDKAQEGLADGKTGDQSKAQSTIPKLVMAVLLPGHLVVMEQLKRMIFANVQHHQRMLTTEQLVSKAATVTGAVSLLATPGQGQSFISAMDQGVWDNISQAMIDKSVMDPYLFITGGTRHHVQIAITDQAFCKFDQWLKHHSARQIGIFMKRKTDKRKAVNKTKAADNDKTDQQQQPDEEQ